MILAEDPTAAAVLDAVPCYPVPPAGGSPAIAALRAARVGKGFAVGRDGVSLILRHPWLELDVNVGGDIICHMPYGLVGGRRLVFRCGLIPRNRFAEILGHFRAALPNEAAAFVLWNEETREFLVDSPEIEAATPTHLSYRTPCVASPWHVVCDVHSHGEGSAFFSRTDDADDMHATKIAMVVGRLSAPEGPVWFARICADGYFEPLQRSPFEEVQDAA